MAAAGGTSGSTSGGGAAAAAASAVAVLATVVAAALVAGQGGGGDDPAGEGCARPPVVFAFGDSNTDTGGVAAGLGYYYPLPEGRAFFRRATGRLCDGRLVIDYLCESSVPSAHASSSAPMFDASCTPRHRTHRRDSLFHLLVHVTTYSAV